MFSFSCVEIQADRSQSDSRQFSGVLFMEGCDQPYPSDLVQNLTWIWVGGGGGGGRGGNSSDVRFLVTNRAGFPCLLAYCSIVFSAGKEK